MSTYFTAQAGNRPSKRLIIPIERPTTPLPPGKFTVETNGTLRYNGAGVAIAEKLTKGHSTSEIVWARRKFAEDKRGFPRSHSKDEFLEYCDKDLFVIDAVFEKEYKTNGRRLEPTYCGYWRHYKISEYKAERDKSRGRKSPARELPYDGENYSPTPGPLSRQAPSPGYLTRVSSPLPLAAPTNSKAGHASSGAGYSKNGPSNVPSRTDDAHNSWPSPGDRPTSSHDRRGGSSRGSTSRPRSRGEGSSRRSKSAERNMFLGGGAAQIQSSSPNAFAEQQTLNASVASESTHPPSRRDSWGLNPALPSNFRYERKDYWDV